MANSGFWKCNNCGAENSDYDTICDSCKAPRHAHQSSFANDKETTSCSSAIGDTIPKSLFKAYVLVLLLLLAGTILICILTPFGKRFISNFNLKLVMDFSTTSFQKIASGISGLGALIIIGCGIYGMVEEDSFIGGAIGGAIIYAALCLVIVLVWNYIVPLIVNAVVYIMVITVCLAFSFGSSVAIVNYINKFILYLNPYPAVLGVYKDDKRCYYEDKAKNKEEFALRKSYFFGPGFFSVVHTMLDAWKANFSIIKRFANWLGNFGGVRWILGWIPFLFFTISVVLFGSSVTLVCSVLHIAFIIPLMVFIYALFTLTWLVDRLFLWVRAVVTVCPVCQSRTVIPYFRCSNPECGKFHTRLVPGTYGIWHRTCVCGTKLPAMFLLGRSKLEAVCPKCYKSSHSAVVLASSNSMPFTISLVGGTSSGKTTMLSAYWHEFFDRADKQSDKFSYSLPKTYESKFNSLNSLFSGTNNSIATENRNNTAIPYTVLLAPASMKKKIEYTLYDIRGEVFNNEELQNIRTQFQFTDSNGILFVIDPLSSTTMNKNAIQEGDSIENASTVDPQTVMLNFINYLTNVLTNSGIGDRICKPAAVVITKADLPSVRKRISYMRIKYRMQQNPSLYKNFNEAKDQECKEFLSNIGFETLVDKLERSFTKVQYFPISAIGHNENGEEYEPEHILEPFDWIIKEANSRLFRELGINSDNQEPFYANGVAEKKGEM